MSAGAVQKIEKPQMRGLFRSYLKRHMAIAILLGFASSFAWKLYVSDPRKRAYAEFYKTYDAEEHYRKMKEAGVLPDFPQVD